MSAEKAWRKLSSFRGIEEFSPVAKSEVVGHGVGANRTCYMPNGAAIYDVMEELEDQRMEMQYKITESPFPINGFIVTHVKVEKVGEGSCKVTWGCEFEAKPGAEAEMVKLFEGLYGIIIDSLEKLIAN